MKILLAVDSSAASDVAIAEVARRPWPKGTSVEVVSAVEIVSAVEMSPAWSTPALDDAILNAADQAVRSAAEPLKASGLACTSRVLIGDPRAAIVDYAAESGADLVVAGSHEASTVMRFLLGSVARAVVLHAPCSVEIVRPRTSTGGLKVLLATDGSEFSKDAARSVASRPWPAGSEFRVISVAELPVAWFRKPVPAYLDPKAMETLRAESMKHAEDAVAAAEQILADGGLTESGTEAVPYASAKEVIISQATEWGADLIVLGSHGRHGASRFLLGSVSEPVAFHAPCSVEIIRARK